MSGALLPWLQLAVCALLIGYAGSRLIHYGETISVLTGLSRSWIGLVLLAAATSLPELFTGISASAIAVAPDIALGDALGSCVINLLLIVILDALSRDEPVYYRIDQAHILTAGFGVILIGFVGALIIVARDELNLSIAHVSVYTPFLILIYLVAMRATFLHERRQAPAAAATDVDAKARLSGTLARYAAAAAVVALAGGLLPFIGMEIVETTGMRTSFVGTLLIAAATSLPEAAVTIAALRRNAADMAIASLLGSNLFDILVIAIDDLAYSQGALLADVSPVHAASAFAAVIMNGIFIVALLFRPKNRFFGALSWVSLSLMAVYLLSAYAIYLHGH
ncbi:MAG: sodium:calcium antiporter [Novosphingobium sp.]|nr:sodium:calcium antiporter [Novosphingobium sp.]MCP5404248.1 sodium:calcium antiporter [Novosphingobium sp.]